MKLTWSERAILRASEEADFIALDNPKAARRWVDGLFKRVSALRQFPRAGRRLPELDQDDFRQLIYGQHRIIYRVTATAVFILTVRRTAQLLPAEDIHADT